MLGALVDYADDSDVEENTETKPTLQSLEPKLDSAKRKSSEPSQPESLPKKAKLVLITLTIRLFLLTMKTCHSQDSSEVRDHFIRARYVKP